jgi:hypothetical protein
MFKYPVTITLILLFAVQTFSKALLILDYQVNKDYIAKNICENRNRPEMKCEGRCYLCKKLRKEEKKDQENPERTAAAQSEVISTDLPTALPAPSRHVLATEFPSVHEELYDRYIGSFFHPPAC